MRLRLSWHISFPTFLVLALLHFKPVLQAGAQDLEIRASRTKLAQETERSKTNMTVSKAEVAYDVEITNKTFEDMKDLEIRYMIIFEVSKPGSTTEPVEDFVTGSQAVDDIPAHKKIQLTTKPVELKSTLLDAGWVWTSGAANKSRDRVVGIWCRVYRNGEMLGEYINPTSLSRRHEWKDSK